MIKSFRGLLIDGGQDKIRLKTNKGEVGYRIVKFQSIPLTPGSAGVEAILKIYKIKQTTSTLTVDFSDQTLLGVSYYQDDANEAYSSSQDIIFDKEIFNQDIYITLKQGTGSHSMNYYLELEQVMLNDNQTTMATLQSLRQIAEK